MTNNDKLIKFPTHFPLKIFGPNRQEFISDIWQLALERFPQLTEKAIQYKTSENNNYIAMTITVYAESQSELDALYIAIHNHPDTKMVL